MSLRSRRKHKAQGEANEVSEPWVIRLMNRQPAKRATVVWVVHTLPFSYP